MTDHKEASRTYDAYLVVLGVAYVKLVEAKSSEKKAAYQKVIDSLMREMAKVDE